MEIEETLNNHPLTYVPDKFDRLPLTPHNLLRIRFTVVQPTKTPDSATNAHKSILQIWRESNAILDHIWSIWSTEYHQHLRERVDNYKFRKACSTVYPQIGQWVLIAEMNMKRNNWRTGQITHLETSQDGLVRSVVLHLPTGHQTTRLISKLYPLEVEPSISDTVPP